MLFFFFNDTATTEIYTLSLHDALPISRDGVRPHWEVAAERGLIDLPRAAKISGSGFAVFRGDGARLVDRKSTRLNSSHANISYAVFCLKKKKQDHVARALAPVLRVRVV